MRLETQTLGMRIHNHFIIRVADVTLKHLTIVPLTITTKIADGKDDSILARHEHLMMRARRIHFTSSVAIRNVMITSMLIDMLVHLTTRHDIEELATSTNPNHGDRHTEAVIKDFFFPIITPRIIACEGMSLRPIQGGRYIFTSSKGNNFSVPEIMYQFKAKICIQTIILRITMDDANFHDYASFKSLSI